MATLLLLLYRSNVSTGYQAKKIAHLRKLGSEVVVVPVNVNTVEKAKALVGSASKLGPIGGFFNLGLVSRVSPKNSLNIMIYLFYFIYLIFFYLFIYLFIFFFFWGGGAVRFFPQHDLERLLR